MNRVTAKVDKPLVGANLQAHLDGLRDRDAQGRGEPGVRGSRAAARRGQAAGAVELAVADDPLARQSAVEAAVEAAAKARGRSTAGRPGQRGGNVKRRRDLSRQPSPMLSSGHPHHPETPPMRLLPSFSSSPPRPRRRLRPPPANAAGHRPHRRRPLHCHEHQCHGGRRAGLPAVLRLRPAFPGRDDLAPRPARDAALRGSAWHADGAGGWTLAWEMDADEAAQGIEDQRQAAAAAVESATCVEGDGTVTIEGTLGPTPHFGPQATVAYVVDVATNQVLEMSYAYVINGVPVTADYQISRAPDLSPAAAAGKLRLHPPAPPGTTCQAEAVPVLHAATVVADVLRREARLDHPARRRGRLPAPRTVAEQDHLRQVALADPAVEIDLAANSPSRSAASSVGHRDRAGDRAFLELRPDATVEREWCSDPATPQAPPARPPGSRPRRAPSAGCRTSDRAARSASSRSSRPRVVVLLAHDLDRAAGGLDGHRHHVGRQAHGVIGKGGASRRISCRQQGGSGNPSCHHHPPNDLNARSVGRERGAVNRFGRAASARRSLADARTRPTIAP
jgi:hypothetical protein